MRDSFYFIMQSCHIWGKKTSCQTLLCIIFCSVSSFRSYLSPDCGSNPEERFFFSRSLIHGSSAAFGKFWGTEQHMGFITAPEHFDGLLRNVGYFTPAHFLFAVYAAVAVTSRLHFQLIEPHTKLHILG